MTNDNTIDIAAIRARLADKTGKTYWQSLDELAETPAFAEFMEAEFPRQSTAFFDSLSRRSFLKLMGASLAMAGLTACYPAARKKLVPYVKQPEDLIPGKPLFFATAMSLGGYAQGLLVESHEGRPTKAEGNPSHPASLGATDPYSQASVLNLYDPDRAQKVTTGGKDSSWADFTKALGSALQAQGAKKGGGLRILTETITSPTLVGQLQAVLKAYPAAKWIQYDPAGLDNAHAGARAAFGTDADVLYHFDKADIVLSLSGDFMENSHPGGTRYARDFASRRRMHDPKAKMSRYYAVESTVTVTGSMADHRLSLKPTLVEHVARAIATRLGVSAPTSYTLSGKQAKFVDALVADLQAHRGRSLVVAGIAASPTLHALVHQINQALGNAGTTVTYIQPVAPVAPQGINGLKELVADMTAGQVDALLVCGSNPVYTAPADLKFADAVKKLSFSASMGLYADETAAVTQWHIPESHYLEAWSDARAYDGTVSLIQPLIEPLYESKSAHELLAAVLGKADASGQDLVMSHWKGVQKGADFDTWWKTGLQEGVVPGTAMPTKAVTAKATFAAATAPSEGLELLVIPDPTVYDGRFNNNAWLQELPKPLTSLVWDNAALVSPRTAEKHSLQNRDMVELAVNGVKASFPVWITPGQADDTVTVTLGYGRGRNGQFGTGRVGAGTGFDAYPLRTATAAWGGANLQVTKLGGTYPLVSTQDHFGLEGDRHDIFQQVTATQLAAGAYLVKAAAHGGGHGEDNGHGAHDNNLHPPATHGVASGAHKGGQSAVDSAALGYNGHDPHSNALAGTERYHPGNIKAGEEQEHLNSLNFYPQWEYSGNAWGMVIDLSTCNGCSACVVACMSENNIPVVGKEEVAIGRELHWIKVDRYYAGDLDEPEVNHQPRMCVHCEKAPCETVCPVEATSHDAEGLNVMTYNRCIGTRYCANNCPYKVRRFNFFQHSEDFYGAEGWSTTREASPLQLMLNPDVSVRSRGVMEKCTYCVQRVNAARIESKKDNRPIRDGEVVSACQAACPTEAIIFGNLNDPNSAVAKAKRVQQNFYMLPELNTSARTTYLAKVTNPNPALQQETAHEHHG